MSLKRKLALVDDAELDAPLETHIWTHVHLQQLKQIRRVPFPNYLADDDDVSMSDAQYTGLYHRDARFPSDVSDASSVSPASLLTRIKQLLQQSSVGLLQPSSSFSHHGTSCSQIPKLKVACASGPNGQRTMWSFCEQCGAISMVDDGSSS
ncbi:hypothetical protein C8F01DRAFT_1076493 [Mycena amicta]|nr:hypothetical protein C8F01DRAFT_1076493 [Mycena amicta]